MRFLPCLVALSAALPVCALEFVEENGFRVPKGFTVQLYAGDELAHDISCLTFDAQGRVVVSGPGYIKTLMPDKDAPPHAPKAMQAVTFSSVPKSGAQGLCFVGSDLFASGDSAVWKFRDADGDGVADGPPEKFIDGLKAGGEHGVHAIVQGPDGWLYVIGGDGSGITEKLNTNSTPKSRIKKSRGGAILRVSLDGKQRAIIAHGFRNPYAMCFNASGNIFAWDSDGERVEHLPGYRPCSLFDVSRGTYHGWLNSTPGNPISHPWHWPSVANPLVEVGRGSPTGMVCYLERQFPEEWQDGIFFACWTFGRIYFCKPGASGSSPALQVFLESVGNQGFAPSGLAVAPDGSMFVASGGRGTKGSVYRIARKAGDSPAPATKSRDAVPVSDAGRQMADKRVILPPVYSTSDPDFGKTMGDIRWLTLICDDFLIGREMRWTDGYVVATPEKILRKVEQHVEWWTASHPKAAYEYARLVAITQAEPEGFWETLPEKWTTESEVRDDLHYLFVAARRGKAHEKLQPIADAWLKLHHKLRERGQSPSRAWPQMVGEAFASMLKQSPALADAVIASPLLTLPDHALFLERLEPDLQRTGVFKLAEVTGEWTPELVKLAGEIVDRSVPKIDSSKVDTQFGTRGLAEEEKRLLKHVAIWNQAEKDENLIKLVKSVRGLARNPALRDAVFTALPVWAFYRGEGTAEMGLQSYQPAVVLKSLDAARLTTWGFCRDVGDPKDWTEEQARQIRALEREMTAESCIALLRVARRFDGQPAQTALVERLRRECWDLVAPGQETLPSLSEIEAAFRKKYPEEARALDSPQVANLDQERTRWSKLDVSKGEATRGKLIYEQRQCARCHSGNTRMGPDLKGVAQRWSVEDLFLHITDPNRAISPAWKGERFVLKDGREFTGAAVYDSPAGMLVQITPDETVRITGPELKERTLSPVSLMPPMLLAGLSDAELADLHAWLKSMK